MSTAPTHPSAASRAIFVSYSHDDAVAARRITATLRGAGHEVWFDENELRSGDTWDAKIKQQIRDCALFLPVISQNTQRRREGYFRLEWHLAEERSRLIARGTPFLVPIAVDDVTERGALVPEVFLSVQWTRLRDGEAGAAFAERVKALLAENDVARVSRSVSPQNTGQETRATTKPGRRVPAAAWIGVAAAMAIAGAAFIALRPAQNAGAGTHPPTAEKPTAAAPASTLISDKSIAVLPLANLSPDKADEFFADGIHIELIDQLQNIRELRVVSRQSVVGYQGTTKKTPDIARELGVAYLLGGSVRRAGNVVRVSVQLIDARGDTQIWSLPAGDRTLDNVFAVQSEIAQATASALKATLSPGERSQLTERPTANTEAYDLFLRSRDLALRSLFVRSAMKQVEEWLQRAVALDPKFARAWTALFRTRLQTYFLGWDGRPERLAEAKAALDEAVKLAPETPETQLALASYYYQGLRDYDRALAQCAAVARLQPNNPKAFQLPGLIQRRQGDWPSAFRNLRTAVALDRGDASSLRSLTQTLRTARRWDEALSEQRRLVELTRGAPAEASVPGEISFLARGSTKEMEDFIRQLERTPAAAARAVEQRKRWARLRGDFAEAIRLDEQQPYFDEDDEPRHRQAADAAITLLATGNVAAARTRLATFPTELRASVRENPIELRVITSLVRMEIILGDSAQAVRLVERALAETERNDKWNAANLRSLLVGVRAWAGQKEQALAELGQSLREPGWSRPWKGLSAGAGGIVPDLMPCRAGYARIPFTTFAARTRGFWSRPWNLKLRRSGSMPMRWRIVACRSRTCTGSLTML
jgi:TolB-like protein